MADRLEHPSIFQGMRRPLKRLGDLKTLLGISVGLLIIIWVLLPLLPEGTGLRFGMGYRIFFTAMLLLGTVFFWFLGKDRIPHPRSTVGVVGTLSGVFLLTVTLLVIAGVVYPQFELPRTSEEVAQEAAERGKELFSNATPPCIQCHSISGRGGTRGPELTHVASRAGERVPELSAEQYLLEKVSAGASYQYNVPEYVPIMPQFEKLLTEEQLADLVAYLISLE
ncbi:MAG: c-type cytochrome [Dehalococcoidia bacterium]